MRQYSDSLREGSSLPPSGGHAHAVDVAEYRATDTVYFSMPAAERESAHAVSDSSGSRMLGDITRRVAA